MATIAGVTVTFALPENDTRQLSVSMGQSQDLSWQYKKIANPTRIIRIPLRGLTTTIKDNLITALLADADGNVSIDPDAHVNLGNGAGTAVNAQWVDQTVDFKKTTHDFWEGELTFVYIS
jgi:hypothetical protein